VREALIEALDDWAYAALGARTGPGRAELKALASAADDDDWRKQFRAADAANDLKALRELSVKARKRSLPPNSLYLLALTLSHGGGLDEAIALMRWARGRHPTDFWIHFFLGTLLAMKQKVTPPVELEEMIGCYRAALALRPDATAPRTNLGNALRSKNQLDDAIAEYKTVLQFEPNHLQAHQSLGNALWEMKRWDEAIAEYRKAIEIAPNDASNHNNLGIVLFDSNRYADAIACFQKSIDLEPSSAMSHFNLGNALGASDQPRRAIAAYRQAIKLDPKYAMTHIMLGQQLAAQNQWNEAIACYRMALRINPRLEYAHLNFGNALSKKGKLDEAIASYRKALVLNPKYVVAYSNLGNALIDKQQYDEAIAELRHAIALAPRYAGAHFNLGRALKSQGKVEEAIAAYRKAIEIQPDYAEAHCNLATCFTSQGKLSAALDYFKRGHALGSKRKDWNYPSGQWVADAERLVELEAILLRVLAKKATPADNNERLGLIEVCRLQRRWATALRLYSDAFARDGKLADDLKASHRYNAACTAALAAAGTGEDAGKLDDKERARLRQQALDWLRADLAAWSKLLDNGPPAARATVEETMKHWRQDTDLAGLRDHAGLAKLAAEERAALVKLWADVAAVLKKAEPPTAKEKRP
jgi:tetratricopeptide (TPR) repeat protein